MKYIDVLIDFQKPTVLIALWIVSPIFHPITMIYNVSAARHAYDAGSHPDICVYSDKHTKFPNLTEYYKILSNRFL